MSTTTTTTTDLLDACQTAHDAMRQVFHQLEPRPVETDDILAALTEVEEAAEALNRARRDAVSILRQRGTSWSQIAEMYGTTRQAAQQRFSA